MVECINRGRKYHEIMGNVTSMPSSIQMHKVYYHTNALYFTQEDFMHCNVDESFVISTSADFHRIKPLVM